jgi:CAAX prenyl protease-like protein
LSPARAPLEDRYPSLPYVFPFACFLCLLALSPYVAFLGRWEFPLRVGILTVVLFVFSRHVIDLRVAHFWSSLALGVAVFAIWIAPDLLIPGYRTHWLFQNSVTGKIHSSIPVDLTSDKLVLVLRTARAVLLVPIIEELFWRSWLLRWLISVDFRKVPLGAYSPQAMWISAILFASEHGPYWDVGLIAGLLYNWWMIRTKSLGDCIFAHAVTNGCLSAYVLLAGKWEYWL